MTARSDFLTMHLTKLFTLRWDTTPGLIEARRHGGSFLQNLSDESRRNNFRRMRTEGSQSVKNAHRHLHHTESRFTNKTMRGANGELNTFCSLC